MNKETRTPHVNRLSRRACVWPARMAMVFLVLGGLLCLGCAQSVKVTHSASSSTPVSTDFFKTQVVVQSPTLSGRDIHTHGAVFAVGMLNNWAIDVSTTLPNAVADALSHSFQHVKIENNYRRGCDNCGLIIRPRITDFGINKITMRASVNIQLSVYDAHESLIATFNHKGKSSILSFKRASAIGASLFVPLVTNFVGKPVINATATEALDVALIDVKDRFATETKDGGVLARIWRPKKKTFGVSEYTAERIARKKGCDMRTDGLHLLKSEFGKEEYEAYCWNVGVFRISCDLGRCRAQTETALTYQEG